MTTRRSARKGKGLRSKGQALVETAVVVTTLVLLTLAIVDAGWAFMELSMVTNAARDGARFGATLPAAQRTASGCITGTTISDRIRNQVLKSFAPSPAVVVTQACQGNVPTVTVKVTWNMPLFFNPGSNINVVRTATFEDEDGRRVCPNVC